MFTVDTDQVIHLTRGDVCAIEVSASKSADEPYIFHPGDVVRFKVFTKRKHEDVVLVKDVVVENETEIVDVGLEKSETKIGGIINKPVDYWYEVEVNPDTTPQTIIGYDEQGPKILRLYPEGGDAE